MARNLAEMVGSLVKGARTPRVVGAGIGARRLAQSQSQAEPRLTLLVNGYVSKDEIAVVTRGIPGIAREADFDILDVGDVRALCCPSENRQLTKG